MLQRNVGIKIAFCNTLDRITPSFKQYIVYYLFFQKSISMGTGTYVFGDFLSMIQLPPAIAVTLFTYFKYSVANNHQ